MEHCSTKRFDYSEGESVSPIGFLDGIHKSDLGFKIIKNAELQFV